MMGGFGDVSGFDSIKVRHLASTPPAASAGSEATPGTAQAAATTKYYFANGKRVAFRRDGTVFYVHSDHPGSAHEITSSGGSVAESF